jgi:hypothetical protein
MAWHGRAIQKKQAIDGNEAKNGARNRSRSDGRVAARVIGRVIVGGDGLAIRGCGLESFSSESALFSFTRMDLPLSPASRR